MVKEKTKMICIDCPIGCEINVTHDGKIVLEIDGNKCKKGIDYAETEITDPRRMVITTVRVRGGFHHLVPVRSTESVPKAKIFPILKKLRKVELKTPVCQKSPDIYLFQAKYVSSVVPRADFNLEVRWWIR